MIERLDLAGVPVDEQLQYQISRYNSTPVEILTSRQRAFRSSSTGIRGVVSIPDQGPPIEEADEILLAPGAFAWHMCTPDVGAQLFADLYGIPVISAQSPIPSRFFSHDSRRLIAAGDFAPYSEKYLRLVEKLRDVGRIMVNGHSMAAIIGVNLAAQAPKHLDVIGAVLSEPPNAEERTLFELMRDLGDDGFDQTHAIYVTAVSSLISQLGGWSPDIMSNWVWQNLRGAHYFGYGPTTWQLWGCAKIHSKET